MAAERVNRRQKDISRLIRDKKKRLKARLAVKLNPKSPK